MCTHIFTYLYITYMCVHMNIRRYIRTYVTGFGKTVHAHTKIIVYYNSHTQALSRHSSKTTIDKQVCFIDSFL